MPKQLKVIADLTVQNSAGELKINNDPNGDLVLSFSNKKTFDNFLKSELPMDTSTSSLNKLNDTLREQRQPVVVRVKGEDWLVLGRDGKPKIKYLKVASSYVTSTYSTKDISFVVGSVIGGILGGVLLYSLFKTRD